MEEDMPTLEIKKRQPENNKGSKKKKCIMRREVSKLEKIREADRTNMDPDKVDILCLWLYHCFRARYQIHKYDTFSNKCSVHNFVSFFVLV